MVGIKIMSVIKCSDFIDGKTDQKDSSRLRLRGWRTLAPYDEKSDQKFTSG